MAAMGEVPEMRHNALGVPVSTILNSQLTRNHHAGYRRFSVPISQRHSNKKRDTTIQEKEQNHFLMKAMTFIEYSTHDRILLGKKEFFQVTIPFLPLSQ